MGPEVGSVRPGDRVAVLSQAGSFTLDEFAALAWRVGVAEGRSRAERASGDGELRVEARMLGPLYNGYMKPSTAAGAGLIEAADDDALVRADRVFAARRAPYFIDTF